MQSYKTYLKPANGETDVNSFDRAYRETFLFQLITDVTNQIPDAAKDVDGYAHDTMTYEQKKRLRNQIYREAVALAETEQKSTSDPDILVQAFLNTKIGSQYKDYITSEWSASGSVRQAYDANIRKWTLDQPADSENFAVTISPYDPLFTRSDLFDEYDTVLYYEHKTGESEIINDVHIGFGGVSAATIGDSHMLQGTYKMNGPLNASGYKLIEHYIKSKSDKAKLKAAMLKAYEDDNLRAITPDEAKYIERALQDLTANGYDFDIEMDNRNNLTASIKGNRRCQLRLLDRNDPQYQGRIYEGGRVVRLGINKNNKIATAENLTWADKLRVMHYYFGIRTNPLPVSKLSVANKDLMSTKDHIKYYTGQLSNDGAPVRIGNDQTYTVNVSTSRNADSGVTLGIKAGNVNGRIVEEPLRLLIGSSAVSSYEDLPEDTFTKQLAITRNMFTNAASAETLLGDKGRLSASFKTIIDNEGYLVRKGLLSDIHGDDYRPGSTEIPAYPEYAQDLILDETGAVKFRDDISDEHINFYRAMVARDELAEWVKDASDNFESQVDFDDMLEKFTNEYQADNSYEYDYSDDETVASYQRRLWDILIDNTHTISCSVIDGETGDVQTVYPTDLDLDAKAELCRGILETDLDRELFGTIPELDPERPGKFLEDSIPYGFYPENVVKYCQHPHSVSRRKNQAYLTHMLDILQTCGYPEKDCHFIAGDSYIANSMRSNLITFDDTLSSDDPFPVTFNYLDFKNNTHADMYVSGSDVLEHNLMLSEKGREAINAMQDYPVRMDMMIHTLKSLGESGCIPDSISVTMDRNGIMSYKGKAHVNYKLSSKDQQIEISGQIGQIFEPDEYGAIQTQYAGDNSKVLIPGYSAFLVPNDPEADPVPMAERLRLVGWKQQMKQAITREIRTSVFTLSTEYNFTPHTAILNNVYKHMYDMALDVDDYKRMLAEKDPEQLETNKRIIRTLAGRCRFPNEYGEGASTMAQSYLDNPTAKEAQNFDYYYSDLMDNENIRVLSSTFDGIFDTKLTGTAKNAGLVRYTTENVQIDDLTGKVTAADITDEAPLSKDSLFAYSNHDTWDRYQMSTSQLLTALHTPRHVGVALMTVNGWNTDDGMPVSKRFAEANKIKDMTKYKAYADSHDGMQPPYDLVDIDLVQRLFTGTKDQMYDEKNHVLRSEFINHYDNPKMALLNPLTEDGDYPFVYDSDDPRSFEEQAAYAIQQAWECEDMLRPLTTQDKLSEMHGNKGVINKVCDPDFLTSNMLEKHVVPADMNATMTRSDGSVENLVMQVPIIDKNGNEIIDDDGNVKMQTVLNWRMLQSPDGSGKALKNPYRTDGYYPFKFNKKSEKSFEEQAVYAIQKAHSHHDMDELLQVFADNPNLDVIMAPHSAMGRFNAGLQLEMMDNQDDLIVNGQTVKGGMGYINMIVVDMPADVKTHWYGAEQVADGEGRSVSAQLMWILNAKEAGKLSDLFFSTNGPAVDKFREYAIAIGLDIDDKLRPQVGYTPIANEKRALLKLNDISSYFADGKEPVKITKAVTGNDDFKVKLAPNVTLLDRQNVIKAINEKGGFMELPFRLDFKTYSYAGRNADNSEDFLLKATGQDYKLSDGKTFETYGLPVLPPNLRAGQEFQDGTLSVHEYTENYVKIHNRALLYMACQEQLLHEQDADKKKALMQQMESCKTEAQSSLDNIVGDIIEKKFDTKHNLVRDSIMKTKSDLSGTAVWSADPRLSLDEVAMSSDHAKLLGLMDEEGNLVKGNNNTRVLLWRDPILHTGGVRYPKVTIDDTLLGIAVNPMIDKSFDGDFDGDSIGVRPIVNGKETANSSYKIKQADTEAYSAFALASNLLNIGEVIEDGPLAGMHPIYLQDGLDIKSNLDTKDTNISDEERTRRQALKDQYENLCIEINTIEQQFAKDPDSVTNVNARTGKSVTGSSAMNIYRKNWVNTLDAWGKEALHGVATDLVVVRDIDTIMQSYQHISDNGSKGNNKKLASLASYMGVDYATGEDGRYIPGSARWLDESAGESPDLKTVKSAFDVNNTARINDNKIQKTAASKADNTALGGTQSQKGVSALRNQAMTEVALLTYPVTQSILQSKHNPDEADMKDFIVRYWGADVWNGYKLTGNFTGTAEEIQQSPHKPILEPILDDNGQPIPKTQFNPKTESWDNVTTFDPVTGKFEPVYQMQAKKCTRDEWVQQMVGMEKALNVNINPDFIERMADIMVQNEPHQVYNIDGNPVMTGKRDDRHPIMSNEKTVAGLAVYAKEHGTLMDRMGYTDKFKALFDEACKDDKSKDSIISGAAAYAQALNNKDLKISNIEANIALTEAEKKSLRNQAFAEVKEARPVSTYFLPKSTLDILQGGSVKKIVDEKGNEQRVRVMTHGIGSKKCLLSAKDITATYMGESSKAYEQRMQIQETELKKQEGVLQTVVPVVESTAIDTSIAVPKAVAGQTQQNSRENAESSIEKTSVTDDLTVTY